MSNSEGTSVSGFPHIIQIGELLHLVILMYPIVGSLLHVVAVISTIIVALLHSEVLI